MDLVDIFGKSATLDTTNATDPLLVIRLQNFQNQGTGAGEIQDGGGIDDVSDVTALTINDYAHKIFASLLKLHLQNQPENNNDETLATYVQFDPTINKQFITRNNVGQIRFNFTVNAYINDTTTTFDPDNLVG